MTHDDTHSTPCDEFVISADPALLDRAAIHTMIAGSYWAAGIPRDVMDRAIDNSLVFGVYRAAPGGRMQVGVARVVSDFATYAYLCDVYIDVQFRGKGLGTRLMDCIVAHPRLQGLRRFALMTRDAHALYARYGFAARADNGRAYMEIARPNMYRGDTEPHANSPT